MKVALCLAGHTRSYRKVARYFHESIFSKYDVDVFISTWIGSGFINNFSFAYLHLPQQYGDGDERNLNKHPGIDEPIDVEHLKSVFNPKDMIIEAPTDPHICEIRERFKGLLDKNRAACDACAIQWFKVWQCNQLKQKYEKEHNFKYDVVMRGRFDFAITQLNLDVDMNSVHCKTTASGITETIYFANSDIMDKATDVYSSLTPEYLSNIINQDYILPDRFRALAIPWHHCMHFKQCFVKPPIVYDFDTRSAVSTYEDFV